VIYGGLSALLSAHDEIEPQVSSTPWRRVERNMGGCPADNVICMYTIRTNMQLPRQIVVSKIGACDVNSDIVLSTAFRASRTGSIFTSHARDVIDERSDVGKLIGRLCSLPARSHIHYVVFALTRRDDHGYCCLVERHHFNIIRP
jgi:hypothetical protein